MQREHLVWLPQIAKAILLLLCASIVAALDTAVVFRLPSVFASVNVPLIAALAATLFMGSTNGVVLAFVLGVLCDVMLSVLLRPRVFRISAVDLGRSHTDRGLRRVDQRRPVGRLSDAPVSVVAVRRSQTCNRIGMISEL